MKKRVSIPVRDVKSLLDLANKVCETYLADRKSKKAISGRDKIS